MGFNAKEWAQEVSDLRQRTWDLTEPILGAFGRGPDGVDVDAFNDAFIAAAEEIGAQNMMWTWASALWPTMPPERSSSMVARNLLVSHRKPWLNASARLFDATARYTVDPTAANLAETLDVARLQLLPACGSNQELWECTYIWARKLHGVMEAAGGWERFGAVSRLHEEWVAGPAGTLPVPLGLVVGTIASGNGGTADMYLDHMASQGVGLMDVVMAWITGLGRLAPAWDRVVVTDANGMLLSMGSVDDMPVESERDAQTRELLIMTRTLAEAVRRGDLAAVARAVPQAEPVSASAWVHWVWLLGRLVGSLVPQLDADSKQG